MVVFFVCWHSSNVEVICRYLWMDGGIQMIVRSDNIRSRYRSPFELLQTRLTLAFTFQNEFSSLSETSPQSIQTFHEFRRYGWRSSVSLHAGPRRSGDSAVCVYLTLCHIFEGYLRYTMSLTSPYHQLQNPFKDSDPTVRVPPIWLVLISHSLNNQHRFLVGLSNLIHPSIPKDQLTAVADLGTGTGYVNFPVLPFFLKKKEKEI